MNSENTGPFTSLLCSGFGRIVAGRVGQGGAASFRMRSDLAHPLDRAGLPRSSNCGATPSAAMATSPHVGRSHRRRAGENAGADVCGRRRHRARSSPSICPSRSPSHPLPADDPALAVECRLCTSTEGPAVAGCQLIPGQPSVPFHIRVPLCLKIEARQVLSGGVVVALLRYQFSSLEIPASSAPWTPNGADAGLRVKPSWWPLAYPRCDADVTGGRRVLPPCCRRSGGGAARRRCW